MNGDAVEKLYERFSRPLETNGRLVLPQGWTIPEIPKVEVLKVQTLDAIIGYVNDWYTDNDGPAVQGGKLLIHVQGPGWVNMYSSLRGPDLRYRRDHYLSAACESTHYPFGQFVNAETFIIGLQTAFAVTVDEPTERDLLIQMVASIRENSVREVTDDGYSQEVKTAAGLTLVERARIKNPWMLAPYRTFREVAQPVSPFLLRAQTAKVAGAEQPMLALFEADGGAWKLEATRAIAEYLNDPDALGDHENVVIIA